MTNQPNTKNKENDKNLIPDNDACCSEKDYCNIDCRPENSENKDIKKGCDCGGNC